MSFIPVSLQLENAIKSNNVIKIEELILNCDTRKDLLSDLTLENGKETLVNLLPHFRSKGLVLNIKTLLNV